MPFAAVPLLVSLILLLVAAPAVVLLALARRVEPDRAARRVVRLGVGLGVALLAAQAAVVAVVEAGGGRTGVDQSVLAWFVGHRDGWATGFALVLASVGGTPAMTALATAAVLVLLFTGRWLRAALVAGIALGGGLLVEGFKRLYDRPRPPRIDQVAHAAGFSLPSGHALGSTVVIGVVVAAALPAVRVAVRPWLVGGAAVLVALIGWCRLYLGVHWLTDVLTGWLLGGAWLAVGVTALALADRVPAPRPPSRL